MSCNILHKSLFFIFWVWPTGYCAEHSYNSYEDLIYLGVLVKPEPELIKPEYQLDMLHIQTPPNSVNN